MPGGTVLITGGLGYLGGRFAQFLVANHRDVRLGSRRSSEPPPWLPNVPVVQTVWQSPTSLEPALAGVETIVHLAGMNAQACADDPAGALAFNGVATAHLVEAAARAGVKRLLYLSTAHVYANPLIGLITEETCPTSLHPYATSHRAGEDVVRSAGRHGTIEVVVVRLSNAYGAPADKAADCWSLLVNDLCRQAVISRTMTLTSTGMQRRDFVPLGYVCRALSHLIDLRRDGTQADLFNLGSGVAPTVWEQACRIQARCAARLGFQPALARVPPAAGDTTAALEFRSDALHGTGFPPPDDEVAEIDHLLTFCQTAFS